MKKFIQLFSKYLLHTYFQLGTVIGNGDSAVIKLEICSLSRSSHCSDRARVCRPSLSAEVESFCLCRFPYLYSKVGSTISIWSQTLCQQLLASRACGKRAQTSKVEGKCEENYENELVCLMTFKKRKCGGREVEPLRDCRTVRELECGGKGGFVSIFRIYLLDPPQ